MRQRSSSTSNSENKQAFPYGKIKGAFNVLFLTLVFLACIDIAVNHLFPIEGKGKKGIVGKLSVYFSYGYSVEQKLNNLISNDDQVGALAKVGWKDQIFSIKPDVESKLKIRSYGQSFTNHVMKEVNKTLPEEQYDIQTFAGPGAPLGHSYYLFKESVKESAPDIAVIGILASTLPALDTMTHFTWNFEGPAPYTYPKYGVENGQLKSITPVFMSYADMKKSFNNDKKWDDWIKQLEEHDAFYDPVYVNESFLDHSVLYRMLLRASAQSYFKRKKNSYHDAQHGFDMKSGIVETARFILEDISATCKRVGCTPIILLFNNRGYSDHLHQALFPTLRDKNISHISSHTIAPAENLGNFIPDGHFTPEIDKKLANLLTEKIIEIRAHP